MANQALEPPYHDLTAFHAGRGLGPVSLARPHAGLRAVWAQKRRYLLLRVPLAREACAGPALAGIAIAPSWVLAVLWDELARRDLFESATDWLAGRLGRDPSVGPFQITASTARAVLAAAPWGAPYRRYGLPELRELLVEFGFAARVAAGRLAQILAHWRDAGHDPFTKGGLGDNKLSALELAATLYSIGLGQPKAHPHASARGAQIALFAEQIAHLVG